MKSSFIHTYNIIDCWFRAKYQSYESSDNNNNIFYNFPIVFSKSFFPKNYNFDKNWDNKAKDWEAKGTNKTNKGGYSWYSNCQQHTDYHEYRPHSVVGDGFEFLTFVFNSIPGNVKAHVKLKTKSAEYCEPNQYFDDLWWTVKKINL